jgi:hypothetical protein
MGAPDSPVRHRTVRCATGQCPVRRHVILSLGLGASRLLEALSSCGTGQSGAPLDSPVLSGTIIRGTLITPNSQLVTPISIKLQRPDGYD